eukprot:jgi/Chlat1/4989/Chrsp32S04963
MITSSTWLTPAQAVRQLAQQAGAAVEFRTCSVSGPSHCPSYKVELVIDNEPAYNSSARSLKLAHHAVSESALMQLLAKASQKDALDANNEEPPHAWQLDYVEKFADRPARASSFCMQLLLNRKPICNALAFSKKEAQRKAASMACALLRETNQTQHVANKHADGPAAATAPQHVATPTPTPTAPTSRAEHHMQQPASTSEREEHTSRPEQTAVNTASLDSILRPAAASHTLCNHPQANGTQEQLPTTAKTQAELVEPASAAEHASQTDDKADAAQGMVDELLPPVKTAVTDIVEPDASAEKPTPHIDEKANGAKESVDELLPPATMTGLGEPDIAAEKHTIHSHEQVNGATEVVEPDVKRARRSDWEQLLCLLEGRGEASLARQEEEESQEGWFCFAVCINGVPFTEGHARTEAEAKEAAINNAMNRAEFEATQLKGRRPSPTTR